MKITICTSTCTAWGARPPQFKFNSLFNEHFQPLIFFKSILLRKNWRDGDKLLLKTDTIDWLRQLTMKMKYLSYCPGWIYIARGPWQSAILQIRPWLLRYVHEKVR